MKNLFIGIVSALLLAGCSSMHEGDTGAGVGSSYPASGTFNSDPTGPGSSSTGQPYGPGGPGTMTPGASGIR